LRSNTMMLCGFILHHTNKLKTNNIYWYDTSRSTTNFEREWERFLYM
jgi:hypothetical protein